MAWTKNDELLNVEYPNYIGGSLEDKFLKITSPTVADGAKYCCTITNAVGSASMDVTFGNFQFSVLNSYVYVSTGWCSFRTIKLLFCQSREYVILYILLGNINDDASPIFLTSA